MYRIAALALIAALTSTAWGENRALHFDPYSVNTSKSWHGDKSWGDDNNGWWNGWWDGGSDNSWDDHGNKSWDHGGDKSWGDHDDKTSHDDKNNSWDDHNDKSWDDHDDKSWDKHDDKDKWWDDGKSSHYKDKWTPDCETQPASAKGLTPGFWKQKHHFYAWTKYDQKDSFKSVFGVGDWDTTLLDAMKSGGGGDKALGRHAVAALLNSASSSVNYAYTTDEVIAMVQKAYATGDFEATKDLFDAANNAGGEIPKP